MISVIIFDIVWCISTPFFNFSLCTKGFIQYLRVTQNKLSNTKHIKNTFTKFYGSVGLDVSLPDCFTVTVYFCEFTGK